MLYTVSNDKLNELREWLAARDGVYYTQLATIQLGRDVYSAVWHLQQREWGGEPYVHAAYYVLGKTPLHRHWSLGPRGAYLYIASYGTQADYDRATPEQRELWFTPEFFQIKQTLNESILSGRRVSADVQFADSGIIH